MPHDVLARLAEWTEVQRLLHELLDAAMPLEAGVVAAARCGRLQPDGRREMFVNWRPCQERIYRLVEFGERINHIGRPFRRGARLLTGARWAVEIVALQLVIEETLSEPRPHAEALVEFIGDLWTACLRHLAIANREMNTLVRAHVEYTEVLGRSPA